MKKIKRNKVRYFAKPMRVQPTKGEHIVARVNKNGDMFMKFYFGEMYKYSEVDNVGGWEEDLLSRDYQEISKAKYYKLIKQIS